MTFMFCILDYVGKHSIYVLSATEWFDTIVWTRDLLVGKIYMKEVLSKKLI